MASTISTHSVFVYGSLMADDVVQALLKRVPQSSPAVLHGYHRFSVKGQVYPAISPVEDKKVTGKVFFEVTDLELHILDQFEDIEYERRSVDVLLMDTSENIQAYTYVWSDNSDPHLYGEWDFEEWKRVHMEDFMKVTMDFMNGLEHPESRTRVATFESFYQDKGDDKP